MSGLILPPGVEHAAQIPEFPPAGAPEGKGVIINETDLPDEVLEHYFVENAAAIGMHPGNHFTTYVAQGNLMTRPKFRVPMNYVDEVALARDFAERDDDVGAAIGAAQALAFGDGMQHVHPDEVTVALFDEIAEEVGILPKFKELYREWFISGQICTATVFTPRQLSFTPMGDDRQRTRTVLCPLVAVLPAEQIRVIGNDIFGQAKLAYRPFSGRQEQWLQEFFNPRTTAARSAQMRQEDPILTTLLTEQVAWSGLLEGTSDWVYADPRDPIIGNYVYTLNPALVTRTTMPKGQWQNPRPPLAKIFPLLEAKRLLTIMDYALLESGANFLVVAKKGSDQKPALPGELANLRHTIARASRSGVLIGDHRLDIEIITPKLDELLNPAKRKLLGRKITQALLRVPDVSDADAGASSAAPLDTEVISRVIASDRDDIRRHVVRQIYKPTGLRNDNVNGFAGVWFPKIVLQGMQFWSDMIITLRDRGDIPRKYAVEAAGFNWTAAVQQRKLEISSGDDEVMKPAAVPFDSPDKGPQDQGGGRPAGAASRPGAPAQLARPTRKIVQTQGETVRAIWEDDQTLRRMGEQTYQYLDAYPEARIGRLTKAERGALEIAENSLAPYERGAFRVVPLNTAVELANYQAVRLYDGVTAYIGERADGALLTRALLFRQPATLLDGVETAMQWGFDVGEDEPEPSE